MRSREKLSRDLDVAFGMMSGVALTSFALWRHWTLPVTFAIYTGVWAWYLWRWQRS